ncbi:MAG: nucleotide exchange factor GrpE [Sphingomonadaceae bacterium]|nr:nucleotide exchange factor GrpE [Sphingomonadaceae bacterium]
MTTETDTVSPQDAAAMAEEAVDVKAPAAELDPRDAEIANLKDQLLRAHAETENVRRRLSRERDDAAAYAVTGFARDLLTVADNLARAVAAVSAEARGDAAVRALVDGVEATERELHRVLQRHGVERVEAVGRPLDPNRHQAMTEVESDEHPAGHVAAEFMAGYMLKERLLRPALVSVAKARAATAPEQAGNPGETQPS